ncbi:MAG: glucokinase [Deltaproteobacteria bacterium]|nr:glucokinase [Deltaproteobacteria bacterium]
MHDVSRGVVLAADVGGTKTRLGLFSVGKRRPRPQAQQTYSSGMFFSLEEIVQDFCSRYPASLRAACFGVAGPVENGRSIPVNLGWEVSEKNLRRAFQWPRVRVINDLFATALAIPLLRANEVFSLNKGRAVSGGAAGLIAPGTGLGTTFLVRCDSCGDAVAMASEGGHADFAPNDGAEAALWEHLYRGCGHVSIERVLSGAGLVNIYEWLKACGRYREPTWLKNALQQADPAKTIAQAALNRRTPIAVAAVKRFSAIFGAAAGNLALTGMTTGGMYLGGGIAPKLLPFLRSGEFMKAFVNKGRFRNILQKIPVRVILNERAALLGAARCAVSQML